MELTQNIFIGIGIVLVTSWLLLIFMKKQFKQFSWWHIGILLFINYVTTVIFIQVKIVAFIIGLLLTFSIIVWKRINRYQPEYWFEQDGK
ncbi:MULTISPECIES: hypothetical protein [Paraliobacillus]|uniref:hypothetical protein n=1 Tax=Paraliobacillus TaxID=200903 RepID=UPI000DD40CCB|nr:MULTISPECIES: hypothetical protein [Paraliobacillus]